MKSIDETISRREFIACIFKEISVKYLTIDNNNINNIFIVNNNTKPQDTCFTVTPNDN